MAWNAGMALGRQLAQVGRTQIRSLHAARPLMHGHSHGHHDPDAQK